MLSAFRARRLRLLFVALVVSATAVGVGPVARFAEAADRPAAGSITDTRIDWPSLEEVGHVLRLRDYNTRLVVLSTAVLGMAAGLIGTFLTLRKRALMGDAISHATLPGVAAAFIVMALMGGSGKSLPGLLAGALAFGLGGVGCVLLIKRLTILGDDAALGIVLSVFFGLGIALLGVIQKMPEGSAAGLESFIYGKTASVVRSDLWLILGAAGVVGFVCVLLYKEFALVCFDETYAAARGWPVIRIDGVMLALVAAVTVIGLQAVGLILIIAMLIIPPAAARFWTERLLAMLIGAAVVGAACGWFGASLSALLPRLPAGAVIVVTSAGLFLVSMIFGPSRGVLARLLRHRRLVRKTGRQHLLRAVYEAAEADAAGRTHEDVAAMAERGIGRGELLGMRSWTPRRLDALLVRGRRAGLVRRKADGTWALTETGVEEAARVVRNHRLWEMYLVSYADVAASHVDRDADDVEDVLGPGLVRELEGLLKDRYPDLAVPPSPHALGRPASVGPEAG